MELTPVLIVIAIVVLYIFSAIQILNEYERGVIFRLGKLLPSTKGPGVILVCRPIDRIVRMSLRTVVLDVPPQDIITRDNVSVKVNAVVYFRVIEPKKAVIEVENYMYATTCWPSAIDSTSSCRRFSTIKQTRGASRCRPSRSSMSISRKTCSGRWLDKRKPSVRSGRRSFTLKAS